MSQHVNGLTDEAFAAATQTSATITDLRRDMATSEGAGFINAPYENRNCLGDPYNSGPYVGYYSPLTGYIYPNNPDKATKAIEILKKLQDEKVINVKSVPRFIELVEAISAIL